MEEYAGGYGRSELSRREREGGVFGEGFKVRE